MTEPQVDLVLDNHIKYIKVYESTILSVAQKNPIYLCIVYENDRGFIAC